MISREKSTPGVLAKKKIKSHDSRFICFVYILISLHPKTKTMQQDFLSEHTPKDNELLLKSNELTQKDLPENLLFYSKEFETNVLKKIIIQDKNVSRIVIPADYVETFLQLMTRCYKNLCKSYPHLSYPMFSDLIYHDFAFCQKRHPNLFLSHATVLTYFKMEMTCWVDFTTE